MGAPPSFDEEDFDFTQVRFEVGEAKVKKGRKVEEFVPLFRAAPQVLTLFEIHPDHEVGVPEDSLYKAEPPLTECYVPPVPLKISDFDLFYPNGSADKDLDFINGTKLRLLRRLLSCGPFALGDLKEGLQCNGVYALYYHGDLPIYLPLRSKGSTCPMYIGENTQYDGRSSNRSVLTRLTEHRFSIEQVGLGVENFTYRFIPLSVGWTRMAEWLLTNSFHPVWNKVLKGFGNKSSFSDDRAKSTKICMFDTFHPGRKAVTGGRQTRSLEKVTEHLKGGLPKCVRFWGDVMGELRDQGFLDANGKILQAIDANGNVLGT